MATLSLSTYDALASEHRSPVDPRELTLGVVHLGVGGFNRGHQLSYLERAAAASGDRHFGVSAYSERSADASDVLAAQDGLYSLRVATAEHSSITVIASLREAHFAQRENDLLIEQLSDPAVRLVTLTVTEKGYHHDPATRRLRRDDKDVLADAGGAPPATVLGQLVRGLEARRRRDAGPITIASCDNLPSNGAVLAGLISEFLELPGRFDAGLADYIDTQVFFPCSMVDRIVPAATDQHRRLVSEVLGVEDRAPVLTEPFTQWVLERRLGPGLPDLAGVGVELVGDVVPYETLKLRALNGTHSAIAYLGLLAGYEEIAAALQSEAIARFSRAFIDEEVEPTLALPVGLDFARYRDEVLERFANPLLGYRTLQVAGDGSQKLPQRVLGTVAERLAAGVLPRRSVLVLAAYLQAITEGHDENNRPFSVSDPLAGTIRERLGGTSTPSERAERFLSVRELFGDELGGDERLRGLLAESIASLQSAPVLAVLAQLDRQ